MTEHRGNCMAWKRWNLQVMEFGSKGNRAVGLTEFDRNCFHACL